MEFVVLVTLVSLYGLFELLDLDWGNNASDDADDLPMESDPVDPATSQTSVGDDRFVGSSIADIVSGQAGDDQLIGLAGDDQLFGDAGNDFIRGGDGTDVLGGGAGDDELLGSPGDDLAFGNEGNDEVNGQAGNDILIGGSGEDSLTGTRGDDVLIGGFSSDFTSEPDLPESALDSSAEQVLAQLLASNPDFDQDTSGASSDADDGQVDMLNGGSGADILFLGAGDQGTGGSDADLFVVSAQNGGEAEAVVSDFSDAEDFLLVTGDSAVAPTFEVVSDGSDALIQSNGEVLARVSGQAGNITASDLIYLQLPA